MNSDNLPNEDSLEIVTIYRSLYILKKKFEKYKDEISKIYTKYFIKDKKTIFDNICCKIIKISSFKSLLEEICNIINITITKISTPKELFILDLMNQKKQNEKLKDSIDQIFYFITDKLNTYNDIFYNKKIKPSIELNTIESINDDFTDYYPLAEYDKKGRLIFYYDQIKELNKNYSYFQSNGFDLEKEVELNKKENNILYIETLPLIIADFIQENPDYNIINNDFNDFDLNNEVKSLFDADILKKMDMNNENEDTNKDLKEESLNDLYNQHTAIKNSILMYNEILNDKKKTSYDLNYIQDFLKNLNIEKIKLEKKIKIEEKNPKKRYFLKNNSSKLKISNNINQLTKDQKLENNLKEIFNFYSNQHNPMASAPTFDEIAFRQINLDLAEFSKFCIEFEIPITKAKIVELFKKNASNRRDMSYSEFKNSLEKIGQEMNNSKKENLQKKIKLYNELLFKMDDIENSVQDFKRKGVYEHFNDLDNPNKFNIRNSHRLNTKKAIVIYDNKKKSYEHELKECELELIKLNHFNNKDIFDEFINFIGINEPKIYRKKMKGFIIPFHDMTERVLQFNIGGYNQKQKKIERNEIIEKMKKDLKKINYGINSDKYKEYAQKKLREKKEKEDKKNEKYKKRMKDFLESKKKGIKILKDEEIFMNQRNKSKTLNKKDIQFQLELEKEIEEDEKQMQEEIKRKEEERKRKEEEKRKKQEEKNGKRTVFSYDKIEKSKIKDIDLNDYDKQLFYDDNSENSDEEVLNNVGKKIERNEIVDDKINTNNLDYNNKKNVENILMTQQGTKNYSIFNNYNTYNKNNNNLIFNKNHSIDFTSISVNNNNPLIMSNNYSYTSNNSNANYHLKTERNMNNQILIRNGENIIKSNKF